MTRQRILTLLDTYAAASPQDRWLYEQTRAFVATHVNVLSRANLQGHLTGSAFVVDPERRRFLLVRHRKLGKWIQPGGHADGDPDLLAVAAREVEEETGLSPRPVDGRVFDLDIHTIPPRPKVPAHRHYDVRFLFVADPTRPLAPKDDELLDAAWLSPGEARRRGVAIEESVARMIVRAFG